MTAAPTTAGRRPSEAVAAPFAVRLVPVVEVGRGVCGRLPDHLRRLGVSRVLVVTDAFLHQHGPVRTIAARLEGEGMAVAVYDGVQPDPTTQNVSDGLTAVHAHAADAVVAAAAARSTPPRRSR